MSGFLFCCLKFCRKFHIHELLFKHQLRSIRVHLSIRYSNEPLDKLKKHIDCKINFYVKFSLNTHNKQHQLKINIECISQCQTKKRREEKDVFLYGYRLWVFLIAFRQCTMNVLLIRWQLLIKYFKCLNRVCVCILAKFYVMCIYIEYWRLLSFVLLQCIQFFSFKEIEEDET